MTWNNNPSRIAAANWRALHGGLVLALLLALPPLLGARGWPFPLLAVLLLDGVIVLALRPLRNTLGWFKGGHFEVYTAAATVAIMVVSSAALIVFARCFPLVTAQVRERLPLWPHVSILASGILFSLLNPLLEEILFRGILLDALDSQLGPRRAVLIQAAAFGIAHAHGMPPGYLGIVMASVYGWWLGLLRQRTQGLLAPYLAHICADATIFILVVT